MTHNSKVQRVASFLPPNKQIFITYAQFQNVQEIPQPIKSKYFDDNLLLIAKMFADAIFYQKEANQIQETDVIMELEDWLSSDGVKFQLQRKTQTKNQKPQRKPQPTQTKPYEEQPAKKYYYHQQGNLSPKSTRQQQGQLYQSHNNSNTSNGYNHTPPRAQTIYQVPMQGRPTAVKHTQRQHETHQIPTSQQVLIDQQLIKRQQYDKQNFGWIDHLSRCLTYPQKRFYIMPEMHPRRKF